MDIKLKHNTFIREFKENVYVYNGDTQKDLFLDKSGGVFLSRLSREWRPLTDIVDALTKLFIGVEKEELTSDAIEFFCILSNKGFVDIAVDGECLQEVEPQGLDEGGFISPLVKQVPDTTQVKLLKMFSEHPRLLSLQIELTNLCNERCVHCYIPHKFKTKKMSLEHYESILDQANELGVLTLVINGGEPLCHPDFLPMLKMAGAYDFNITILSNLTQLTDEIIDYVKYSHVSEIQTSIYSLNPVIHDGITKTKGSLELTLQNLFKLKENGIRVRVACVLMKQNLQSYQDLIQWSKEHQIPVSFDYILFGRYDYSTDNLDYRLSKDDVEQVIRYTIENNDAYVQKMRNTDFQLLDEYYKLFSVSCNVGRSTLCIACDGSAYPCIGWQGYKLGNIEKETLVEIWNSPKLNRLRQVSRTDFDECRDCEDKFFCSRCLVRNANENDGDFMKLSKLTCELAHLNRTTCRDLLQIDYKFKR